MSRHLRSSLLTTLLAGALLASCGGAGRTAETGPGPTSAPEPPTAAPTAPVPSLPAATALPVASSAAAPAQATAPAADAGRFADIPQSRTPEGYQVLGAPDAPVTLVMYSDFL